MRTHSPLRHAKQPDKTRVHYMSIRTVTSRAWTPNFFFLFLLLLSPFRMSLPLGRFSPSCLLVRFLPLLSPPPASPFRLLSLARLALPFRFAQTNLLPLFSRRLSPLCLSLRFQVRTPMHRPFEKTRANKSPQGKFRNLLPVFSPPPSPPLGIALRPATCSIIPTQLVPTL